MINANGDRESGTAQAFGILGGGNAKITWVDDYRQGACTTKLSDNEWAVVLPEDDPIVQLHEQSHIKYSGWDSSAIYNQMGDRARQLFAIIEDARVDTLGSDWYRRDLYGDHGGRILSETGPSIGSTAGLGGPVTAISYGLDVPLSKIGEGVRLRFGQRIADVQTDPDPWASARLAYEIDRAYDSPEQDQPPDQDQDQGGQGQDQGQAQDGRKMSERLGGWRGTVQVFVDLMRGLRTRGQSQAQDDGSGADGGSEGQGDQRLVDVLPDRLASVADQGRELDDSHSGDDEAEWRKIKRKATREAQEHKALAEAERDLDKDERDHRHRSVVTVHEPRADALCPTESTVLASQTVLALDGLTSGRPGRYDRVGTVTPEVWRLGYGEGRVFERPPRRRGRVVVAVDYSGSMGCPCENHRDNVGWLAAQSAAAISQAASAEVFGWTGNIDDLDVLPLEAGTQPTETAYHSVLGRGTPTGYALDHLATVLDGETQDALGVFITDGCPDEEWRAVKSAERLYAEGVRYAVVVVGPNAHESYWRAFVSETFPHAVVVSVANADDLAALGPALSELLGA